MGRAGFVDFVIVLIVLVIVCAFLMRGVSMMNRRIDGSDDEQIDSDTDKMQFVFERRALVNCAETRLPCTTDRQCYDNCINTNLTSDMHCDEGFCTARVPFVGGHRPEDFVCDPKLGLLNVFTASEFVVTQLCVSTYRDLVDDLGEPRPYLCGSGGRLDIDLVTRQFTVDDCVCASGYTHMLFNQGALTRAIPVCIPNKSAVLFSRIYEQT
ncbi:ORF131 [Leucania separata nucleopolyhedrovirus]|uniref:ORF131 n=1 Tax=Leucania separata nucleopolyhedrovirus TaxID=1307956 RepID=Q0IKY8_NPVLS|nr:ORF131 [Leucania separata nucleopolyhedrovirus]AAR28895.1 ORF131 [Leucania separata nucleopolyhedrovirus]